jgi:hypothetical protein
LVIGHYQSVPESQGAVENDLINCVQQDLLRQGDGLLKHLINWELEKLPPEARPDDKRGYRWLSRDSEGKLSPNAKGLDKLPLIYFSLLLVFRVY